MRGKGKGKKNKDEADDEDPASDETIKEPVDKTNEVVDGSISEPTNEPEGETIDAAVTPPDGVDLVAVTSGKPTKQGDPVDGSGASSEPISFSLDDNISAGDADDHPIDENIDANGLPPVGAGGAEGNDPATVSDTMKKPMDESGIVDGNELTTLPATTSKLVVATTDANALPPVGAVRAEGNNPATVPNTTKKPIVKTGGEKPTNEGDLGDESV
jgi:hypothetical protein